MPSESLPIASAPPLAGPVAVSRWARAITRGFSFPVMLAFGLAVVACLTVSVRFNDPDLWWHLKVGEVIWQTGAIPPADTFSFTAAGHPWVAHEWLAEVSMYAAYAAGGYSGVMVWLSALASLLLIAVYGLSYLRTGNVFASFLGGIGAWLFATVGFTARPLLLGHVFLVLELILLELSRRDRRWLWLLPPLFAVWVNCHGSFLFGIGVFAAFWAAAAADINWGPFQSRKWPLPSRRLLSVTLGLSVAALFCNPIGIRLLTYPFNAFFMQKTNLGAVTEWAAPELHDSRTLALLLSGALLILMPLLRRVEARLEDALIVLPAFYLAFQHSRMLFLFGVVAVPVLCAYLAPLLPERRKKDLPVANAVFMAFFALAIIAAFPGRASIQDQITGANPAGAVEYIRKAGLKGPMLNQYLFGGYLMWALPEEKVFIDGRTDIYDWTGVMEAYGRWATLSEESSRLLDKYGIQFCLLSNDSPMSHVVGHLPGWRRVYADQNSTIFKRQRTDQITGTQEKGAIY